MADTPEPEDPRASGSSLGNALRGFLVLAGANFIGQALGFVALSIVARRIGPAALGDYNFALALSAYFGLLSAQGVAYAAMRDLSLFRDRVATIASESLAVQVVASGIAYGLLVVLADPLTPNRATATLVPVVGITILLWALTLDWIVLALGQRKPVANARVVGQVVYAALVPVFVVRGGSALPYAWLNVLGLTVTALLVLITVARRRLYRPVSVRPVAIVRRFRRGIALSYSLIMIQLYSRADILLLGYISTAREVGLYSVANRLPLALVSVATVWIQSVMPHASVKIRDEPARYRAELSAMLTGVCVLALAISFGSAVVPTKLMTTLFGEGFAKSAIPFVLLSVAMALVLIEAVLSNVLIAGKQDRKYAQIVTLAAIANVALNLAFIPVWQASGSAFATVLTELLLILLTVIAGRDVMGMPSLSWNRIARGGIAVLLMCGTMYACRAVSVWFTLISGAVVFVGAAYLLDAFDSELWKGVRRP